MNPRVWRSAAPSSRNLSAITAHDVIDAVARRISTASTMGLAPEMISSIWFHPGGRVCAHRRILTGGTCSAAKLLVGVWAVNGSQREAANPRRVRAHGL